MEFELAQLLFKNRNLEAALLLHELVVLLELGADVVDDLGDIAADTGDALAKPLVSTFEEGVVGSKLVQVAKDPVAKLLQRGEAGLDTPVLFAPGGEFVKDFVLLIGACLEGAQCVLGTFCHFAYDAKLLEHDAHALFEFGEKGFAHAVFEVAGNLNHTLKAETVLLDPIFHLALTLEERLHELSELGHLLLGLCDVGGEPFESAQCIVDAADEFAAFLAVIFGLSSEEAGRVFEFLPRGYEFLAKLLSLSLHFLEFFGDPAEGDKPRLEVPYGLAERFDVFARVEKLSTEVLDLSRQGFVCVARIAELALEPGEHLGQAPDASLARHDLLLHAEEGADL